MLFEVVLGAEISIKEMLMDAKTKIITVRVREDVHMQIESTLLGSEQDVSAKVPDFKKVTDAIETIAATMGDSLKRIQPRKASVEFGIEVGLESGQLTALLVKGTSKANLKISLHWDSADLPPK
jgi:hypothetical protein